MTKKDITQYSDNELSLMVFNTEGLYNMRGTFYLEEFLNDNYVYTARQWQVLQWELEEDREDNLDV